MLRIAAYGIPLALVLVAVVSVVFCWAVKSGQFDDLEGPAQRILLDDDGPDADPRDGDGRQADSSDPDRHRQSCWAVSG